MALCTDFAVDDSSVYRDSHPPSRNFLVCSYNFPLVEMEMKNFE